MKFDFHKMMSSFIINEGESINPTINSWIQALSENIGAFKPRTLSEKRRIEVMKHQLNELRKSSRKLQEQVNRLKEQVNILQEEKTDE
jgi:polyhydroxyalkanoate synthesis regulator phasin